tara:strand:+ start:2364 stop:2576 length:213 start_codon:yes stop_codon:yes gene_type:complete
MTWNYRIRKRIIKGKSWYDIVEFYNHGTKRSWTESGMKPEGETKKDVIWCLVMMLKDAKKYNAFTDKEEK